MAELEYLDSYTHDGRRHDIYADREKACVHIKVFQGNTLLLEKDYPLDVNSPNVRRILKQAGIGAEVRTPASGP